MPAGTYNFVAEQGATLERVITWRDDAGALVSLTGCTANMQVRSVAESAIVILDCSEANGRIVLGGAAGTITITVAAATMSAIAAGTYVYDLELTAAGGKVTRLIEGKFQVKSEVTR